MYGKAGKNKKPDLYTAKSGKGGKGKDAKPAAKGPRGAAPISPELEAAQKELKELESKTLTSLRLSLGHLWGSFLIKPLEIALQFLKKHIRSL